MVYNNYSFTIPEGKSVRIIIDSDAKNEADDQYAIVHALLSPRFDIRGIIAAHFGQEKSKTSMEDSYNEIIKILKLMKIEENGFVFKGTSRALSDEYSPSPSSGSDLIIQEAMRDDPQQLYVICLGPLTDIASAYLQQPMIEEKLTVIWIGGGKYLVGGWEYNLSNDINAANVVFNSRIPLWQVPRNVYQKIVVSLAELEYKVKPYGEIGEYLFNQLVQWGYTEYGKRGYRTGECWCLGDSPAVGLLLFEHMFDYEWIPAPRFDENMHYILNTNNRPIRVYNFVDSRFILEDFYAKLAIFSKKL